MKLLSKLTSKYKKFSQLKKNVLSGSIFSGVNILVTLISYPLYLKYLGVEQYGLWATVSVVLAFSQIGLLRINTAVVKYVAGEYGKKNFQAITEYISTSLYILLVPSLIIIILLAFLKSQIAGFLNLKEVFMHHGTRLIFFVGLLSVFSFFVHVIKGVMSGIGRMDIANYIFLFSRISQVILAVGLLILGCGVWSLYFGFLLYFVLPLIICWVILGYIYHIKVFSFSAFRKQKLKELIKFGGALTTANIANMFVMPFNKIIIARYVGLSEVAYYEIAIKVITSIRGLFVKGLEAILPKISELHGKATESLKSILSIHRKGMKFILLGAFPLFLIMFILANPILKVWLGERFNVQIVLALRILLIGWFFNLLAVPDYFMFMGADKVKYSVIATCLKSITNIVTILVLLFLNIQFTLSKVAVIDSASLLIAVIYLKYKYFKARKINRAVKSKFS